MIDGLPLILLGMGVASAIAMALRRRKRRPPTVPTSLSTLSDQDLLRSLAALQHDEQPHEIRRRMTLLIIEEIERREHSI